MSELDLVRRLNDLQRQVNGLIKPEVGRWVDWTPTITQLGAVTVTIVEAKYHQLEDLVHIYCELNVTGTGTAANAIVLAGWPSTIDPTPTPTGWPVGVATIIDSSVATYSGIPFMVGSTTIRFFHTNNNGTQIGSTPSFGLVSGDFIYSNMYWKI